ncbi:MAG: hypothetical protein PUG33_00495 [Mollicutes bacterium]|nr:hypothetical protein [Mollicutes bacterium]
MRRMDRYKDETPDRPNRYEKNQELYQDIASNTKYTNITDVTNSNAFEINGFKNKGSYTSRESYQQMKKYKNVESVPRIKKELDDFNYLYKIDDKKVYDINIVLEEARKNRQEKDKLEEKRKLKNTSYNILADLNIEELEKYKAEKIKKIMTPEEEEFRDLIDTIASKTLAGEIDKETSVNLLSDLMATSVMDKVEDANSLGYDNASYEDKESNKEETEEQVSNEEQNIDDKEELDKVKNIIEENKTLEEKLDSYKELKGQETEKINSDSIEEKKQEKQNDNSMSLSEDTLKEIEKRKDEEPKTLSGADKDFYTRSMDLSDEDFEMDNEFKEKSMPITLKILIAILVIALIAVAAYFIYKRM